MEGPTKGENVKRVIALLIVVLIVAALGGVAYANGETTPTQQGKVSRAVDGAKDLTGAHGELTDKELDT